ncbi:MAG: hypothetical protein B7Z55_09595 [Planctomycetales bacterium 12-60-4]|nr:MAG: hypothetical protein B7Z55_09595 [Planctomycetales bacterium 12-60-4]
MLLPKACKKAAWPESGMASVMDSMNAKKRNGNVPEPMVTKAAINVAKKKGGAKVSEPAVKRAAAVVRRKVSPMEKIVQTKTLPPMPLALLGKTAKEKPKAPMLLREVPMMVPSPAIA